MGKDNVFRLTCSCGCGDGFEARAAHGTLYVSFYRSDWYAQQHAFRSSMSDKMNYMKGNRLLREVVVSREDLIAFRDFLNGVTWDEQAEEHKNSSHITPMHLLDEIYALWLEGDLPEFDVLKGKFHRMFELELSEMERDVLVMQIDKWLKREEWHAIPVGESPHVDRITAGITDDDDEEVIVEDNELTEDNSDVIDKIVPEEVITPTDEVNGELWCDNQQLDNKNEVMCLAHLADGRVLSCPYKTLGERNEAEFPCSDYMPIEDIIEETEEDKSEDDVVIRRVAVEDIVPRAREEYEELVDEPSTDDDENQNDFIPEDTDESLEEGAQEESEDSDLVTETLETVSSEDDMSDDELEPDESLEEVSEEIDCSEVDEDEKDESGK